MTFLAGPGTGLGRDYTVFATVTGKVKFEHATKDKKRIRVEAVETAGGERLARPDRAGDHRRGDGPARTASEENNTVKPDIHPKYYEAKVHCGSCGTEWTVGSTRPELRVDVCSNCHPFFTGKQNDHRHRRPGRALPEAPRAPGPQLVPIASTIRHDGLDGAAARAIAGPTRRAPVDFGHAQVHLRRPGAHGRRPDARSRRDRGRLAPSRRPDRLRHRAPRLGGPRHAPGRSGRSSAASSSCTRRWSSARAGWSAAPTSRPRRTASSSARARSR